MQALTALLTTTAITLGVLAILGIVGILLATKK